MSKQMFIQAYESRKARQEADQERDRIETAAETHKIFVERFGFEPDRVDYRKVYFEDVELVMRFDNGSTYWSVVGHCPDCGLRTQSHSYYGADEIGKMLVRFEPDWDHRCPKSAYEEAQDDSWQARLADAIADAIRDHLPQ